MVAGRPCVGLGTGLLPVAKSAEPRKSGSGRAISAGLGVGSTRDWLFSSRQSFSSSRLAENLTRNELGGRFAKQGLGTYSVQGGAFWSTCAVSSLLVCAAAKTETAQASGTDSDLTQGSVILYNYSLAFNPAKAKLALEEKGIKYTEEKIDLFNGQSLEPWYLKLNPAGSSPTLVVGSEKIVESADIIRWADKQGIPLGGDSVDRAFVNEWLQKVDAWDGNLFAEGNSSSGAAVKLSTEYKIKVAEANATRYPDLAELYKKKLVSLKKSIERPSNSDAREKNLKQLSDLLDEAEARLSSTKFLAGDAYSAADIIFTPVLFRVYQVKKDAELLDSRPNIKLYYEELKKRPSFKPVFAAAESGLLTALIVLPAFAKIFFVNATGKY